MFDVAPWESPPRRLPGVGLGGRWTSSSRFSPSTVMWCTAVPGAKPAPSTHRVATAADGEVVVAWFAVDVGAPPACGELELHAASAGSAIPTVNAARVSRMAVI